MSKAIYIFSVLIFSLTLMNPSSARATVFIKGCNNQETIEKIKQGLNFVLNHLPTVQSEEFSYINHIWEYDFEIEDQTPFYILESDRYQTGLTNEEVIRMQSNITARDLSIRCAKEGESSCHGRGAYASVATNFFHLWLFNGGSERSIVLCNHENVRKCSMVGTLAHEIAHIADIEMRPGHGRVLSITEGNEYHRFDKVFKIGKAMENVCDHDQFDFVKVRRNSRDYYISEY